MALELTRNYLISRQNIISREVSNAVNRAEDGRASSYTQQFWRDTASFFRGELDLVNQAIVELNQHINSIEDTAQ